MLGQTRMALFDLAEAAIHESFERRRQLRQSELCQLARVSVIWATISNS